MEVFKDYAYYYNALYRDKDYKKEAEQIVSIFKRYKKDIKAVINFGCGTGKHDVELSKLGYECIGVDMSPVMIDMAREIAEKEKANIDFHIEDIRQFKAEKKYDAVISLFHVMSYQNTNEDILKAFASARAAVKKNGIFLFDVWYGPGVLSDKPCVRVKEIEDHQKKIIRIAKPVMHDKHNIVDVQYDVLIIDKDSGIVETICETHNMRYFFRPELELMLNQSGFKLIDNLDCETLEETGYNSWTSYFVAEAV